MTETALPHDATLPAIERTMELSASPERVWRAITDPRELSRWFPDRAELDVRVGADGTFFWNEHGSFALRIEAVEEPSYFAWRWANEANTTIEAAAEVTLVEWRLSPAEGGGTVLTIRESGFTRPGHRDGNDRGWTSELAELVELLDCG